MIRKSVIAYYTVIVILLMMCNTFAFTSFGLISRSLSMLFGVTGFAILINYYGSFPKFFRRISALFLIVFIQSILATHFIYNQSIQAGVISNSYLISSGAAILCHFLIIRYQVEITKIFNGILTASWILFIYYLILFSFDIKFEVALLKEAIDISILNKTFVTLGSIIYISKYYQTGRVLFLVFAVILFSTNLWADFQRNIFLIFCSTLIVGAIVNRNKLSNFRLTFVLLISIPLLVVILPNTQFGQLAGKKMSDAIEIFDNSKSDFSDRSVGVRFEQIDYAVSIIKKYPITGVGRVSIATRSQILGDRYFFPSDIGIIGTIYNFGILGLLFFLLQLKFVLSNLTSRLSRLHGYELSITLYLFFFVIQSVFTGKSVIEAGIFFFLTLIFLERNEKILETPVQDEGH